ncbi:MAG: hypothetical protein WC735_04380 [Candidatus Paceibacterota bacterium]|jgi:hypothetical protein
MKFQIPSFVKAFLWSYDIERLDRQEDKKRIITNVLNFGTKKATDWLFEIFDRDEVREAIKHPFPGEWNRKSLNFWSLIFDVKPGTTMRVVPK